MANINVDKLQENLQTKRFGRSILFAHKVRSTNDWAKELANLGAREGTVAIAETQMKGRGRLDRKWFSPQGGLWFSIILRPKLDANEAAKLVFAAGLAVAETVHELCNVPVETKWPNDVLVNGKKICGILSEMKTTANKVEFAVVGIGVNANFEADEALPKQLRNSATSLQTELGKEVKLNDLFTALLQKLECYYDLFLSTGFNPVLQKWKTYAAFLGHHVEVISQSESLVGLALDVNADGALVLRLEDGIVRRVFVGDVFLLKA
jgi:BirA family biotin operon repressor/biotin-[acetyl-CoA-carboxylase] ligase